MCLKYDDQTKTIILAFRLFFFQFFLLCRASLTLSKKRLNTSSIALKQYQLHKFIRIEVSCKYRWKCSVYQWLRFRWSYLCCEAVFPHRSRHYISLNQIVYNIGSQLLYYLKRAPSFKQLEQKVNIQELLNFCVNYQWKVLSFF